MDAALALHILLVLQSHCTGNTEVLNHQQLLTGESFLSCQSLQNMLFTSYNPSLATVANGLNCLHGAVVVAMAASVSFISIEGGAEAVISPSAIRVLLYCLVFPGRDTFESVAYFIRNLLLNVHGSCASLLAGLVTCLHEDGMDQESRERAILDNFKVTSKVTASEEDIAPPSIVRGRLHFAYLPPSRLRSAILTLLSSHAHCKDIDAWPQALYLAAHPGVCAQSFSNAHSLMKIVRDRFTLQDTDLPLPEMSQLLDWSVLNSDCKATRQAGCGVLALLYCYTTDTDSFQLLAENELRRVLSRSVEGIRIVHHSVCVEHAYGLRGCTV